MIITQKKIMKVPFELNNEKKYFVSVDANSNNLEKLNLKKFESNLKIQPSTKYGITCRRNINGYFKIEKDKPKERRFVRTIYWEWQLFNGDWQSEYKDIYKECYPRKYYQPLGIEMILSENLEGKEIIITKIDNFDEIKNIINLYLEVFGYCEILDENLKLSLNNTKFIRRNWEILPPEVKINIQEKVNKKAQDEKSKKRNFNQARLDALEGYNPLERNIGKNGFQGYYAYIYKDICVLESPIYGNATYIVDRKDWKVTSKMTKTELINSGKLLKRIEHNSNWFTEINLSI